MQWSDVVGSLPGAIRTLLTPSEITLPDRDGKRIIYAGKAGAVLLNYRIGSLITIMRLIHNMLDAKTNDIEIALPEDGELGISRCVQSWNNIMLSFPGTTFIGYEKEVESG